MPTANLVQSTLQLVFQTGADMETGRAIYKSKSFSNVKPEATAEQLYVISQAFEGLQKHPLTEINRRDNSEIYVS